MSAGVTVTLFQVRQVSDYSEQFPGAFFFFKIFVTFLKKVKV